MAATQTSMVNYVKAFFDRLLNKLQSTAGNADNALFYDNSNGVFSFTSEPAINIVNVATTPAELAAAKTEIAAKPNHGLTLLNAVNLIVEVYDPDAGTWSTSATSYFSRVKQQRVFYSPWSTRVWFSNDYGALTRLRTSTRTLVG